MATPVCRLGKIALITRRSQVQILPPQPIPLASSVLTDGASAFVRRVANPKGAMRISRRIRRRLRACSSGRVRSLPFVETILTRSCPRIRRVQRADLPIRTTDSAAVSEEGLDEPCRRACLQLRDGADLDEPACLEHCDAIRQCSRLAQVMSNEEDGKPSRIEKLPQQSDQLLPEHDIDVRKRLVEQERHRLSDQSAS